MDNGIDCGKKQIEYVATIKETANVVFEEINSNIYKIIKDRGLFTNIKYVSAEVVIHLLNDSYKKVVVLHNGCFSEKVKNF
ncbi:hypothetical protein [Paenibacillus sp. ISL-20]|uniref:hypothetical protein n=1 Tax=Paenibacillus sp. ISL-20 TaxID=2819163 RepID=UPI001BEAB22C|nr:hypothetical protein [Paenibacillus sp. ISL-20]MBT2759963.1 hypothetical protein [Paenibacillus sp. ISL-20]